MQMSVRRETGGRRLLMAAPCDGRVQVLVPVGAGVQKYEPILCVGTQEVVAPWAGVLLHVTPCQQVSVGEWMATFKLRGQPAQHRAGQWGLRDRVVGRGEALRFGPPTPLLVADETAPLPTPPEPHGDEPAAPDAAPDPVLALACAEDQERARMTWVVGEDQKQQVADLISQVADGCGVGVGVVQRALVASILARGPEYTRVTTTVYTGGCE